MNRIFPALFFSAAALTVSESTLFLGAGFAFQTGEQIGRAAWTLSFLTPWSSTWGEECLLLSSLCGRLSRFCFQESFRKREKGASLKSWKLYREALSSAPAMNEEERELLAFLSKRWLAKANGFSSLETDWVCPSYGIPLQVHPETTSCYARDPGSKASSTYLKRVEEWKEKLPHPKEFPLILTRPSDVRDYLPLSVKGSGETEIENRIGLVQGNGKLVVDLTEEFSGAAGEWEICKARLSRFAGKAVCIQRLSRHESGGIRILPLSEMEFEEESRFLLEWVSHMGLSASPLELDRFLAGRAPAGASPLPAMRLKREECLGFLSERKEVGLMAEGARAALEGFFRKLPEDVWEEALQSPARSAVAALAMAKIREEWEAMEDEAPFFETALRVEQIFSHLSSLLEIFSLYTREEFSRIYQEKLPLEFRGGASCALHSTAMGSVAGLLKAARSQEGKTPRVLLGENVYFECKMAAESLAEAKGMEQASEDDWESANLLFVQFNPVLKRSQPRLASYRTESVGESLRRALRARRGKPLTAAVDCTIDFIDSPRFLQLIRDFSGEIESGALNIVSYRSGLKFDLFGMDNYAGAPFFLIHNLDPKWEPFDALLTEPVLLADRLSANWFCLAYEAAEPLLEEYRRKIFRNTRDLLSRIPKRLADPFSRYRVVPVEASADPAFIDVRVAGPLHRLRAAACVAGFLYLACMEGGHPMFYRRSIGFFHPNFGVLFGENESIVRLTLGLDPAQVDLFTACFETIDRFNGACR